MRYIVRPERGREEYVIFSEAMNRPVGGVLSLDEAVAVAQQQRANFAYGQPSVLGHRARTTGTSAQYGLPYGWTQERFLVGNIPELGDAEAMVPREHLLVFTRALMRADKPTILHLAQVPELYIPGNGDEI